MQAVRRILCYLKTTLGKSLLFRPGKEMEVVGYIDADNGGSLVDRRSTKGYYVFLGGNLVSWRRKKQNVVARSSAEAEFRAMAFGRCELLWLRIVLEDLKIPSNGPMKLCCDNQSNISIARKPVQHDRTKHVEIDHHFIKKKLESKEVCMLFVTSANQIAGALTKGLPIKRFEELISKLGMIDIHSPA